MIGNCDVKCFMIHVANPT